MKLGEVRPVWLQCPILLDTIYLIVSFERGPDELFFNATIQLN